MITNVERTPENCAFDHRGSADVGARVDHGPLDAAAVTDGHPLRKDGVRADDGVRRDLAVVADERRAFDVVDGSDLDPLAQPHVAAQADAGDAQAHALVEGIEVRLAKLLERADVLPVAVEHVPVDRPAHLEEQREQLLREIERAVTRHMSEHLGLDDVDARVDRVGEHLAPGRLFQKPLHAPVLVADHDSELEWVVDGLEADRDRRALLTVPGDQRAEIDVAQRVARDDDERLVEPAARQSHRSGRAERLFLDGVLDLQPERFAVPEVRADRLRHERERDHDLLEPVRGQQLQNVLHAGLADDRHHRLRLVGGEGTESRPFAARHHHGLHSCTSRTAWRTYCTAATTARPRLTQKHASGHHVPCSVTRTRPSDGYSPHVAIFPSLETSNE